MPSQFQFILQYVPAAPNLQCPEREREGESEGGREMGGGSGGVRRVREILDCPIILRTQTYMYTVPEDIPFLYVCFQVAFGEL
jgi:hypothetical protein